jgi:hypothetical protein
MPVALIAAVKTILTLAIIPVMHFLWRSRNRTSKADLRND